MADITTSIGSLTGFFERLITDFSRRRLVVVVTLLCIPVAGLICFEWYTRSFMLTRLNQEVALLARMLEVQDQIAKTNDKELRKTFEGLSSELGYLVQGSVRGTSHESQALHKWEKSLYFALPWVILLLLLIFLGDSEDGGRAKATLGILVCAIPIILLGTYLPDFERAWINHWLLPWGLAALVVTVLVVAFSKDEERHNPTLPAN